MDYFDTGFCVRTASWHRKELLLAEHPTDWDDARRAAGLLWEPTTEPLFQRVTKVDSFGYETHEFVQISSSKLVTRDDTKAELGTVGQSFELITHAEMGPIIETVLDQPSAKFDTAGSVKGGRQVYATIMLDEPYQIRNDVDGFGDPVLTLPYFVILNSHDGSGSCKGLYSQVRVVCANTYQAASMDGDRHGAQFVLRHTSGVKARLEDAKNVIEGARIEALRWREIADQLGITRVTPDQEDQFLSGFIPMPAKGVISDKVAANVEADRAKFRNLLVSNTNAGTRGTALCLVNASVEFLDHVRGYKNAETLMGRQLLKAEPLKARALSMVRELTGAPV